jgi:hypothetical protein
MIRRNQRESSPMKANFILVPERKRWRDCKWKQVPTLFGLASPVSMPTSTISAAIITTSSRCAFALVVLVTALAIAGCSEFSGFLPSLPGLAPVVSPDYLAGYTHGGSMATLWYLGSDRKYHYFAYYVKTNTRFRVRRIELDWKPEFPLCRQDPIYVGPRLAHLLSPCSHTAQ